MLCPTHAHALNAQLAHHVFFWLKNPASIATATP